MRIVCPFVCVCILALTAACSTREETPKVVQVTLPYFSGCEETIRRLSSITDQSAKHNKQVEGVEVVEFDVKPMSHGELSGYLVLYMQADAQLLSGKTVKEYLILKANGVLAACMPTNWLTLSSSDLVHYSAKLSVLQHKGAIFPRTTEGGMRFYYNDGSYEYPEWK